MKNLIIDGQDFLDILTKAGSTSRDKLLAFRELGYSIVVRLPQFTTNTNPDLCLEWLARLAEERDNFDQLHFSGESEWDNYLYLDDKALTPTELVNYSASDVFALVNLK